MTEVFTRDITNRLWESGQLEYKLRPIQRQMSADFDRSSGLIHVFNCSRRIGKTFRLLVWASEIARRSPGSSFRFAAPTRDELEKISLPLMSTILRDCPGNLLPTWKDQKGYWRWPNGSTTHMAGVNNGNADRLRGTSADGAAIEEAGFVDDLDYLVKDVLMPQLLTTGGRMALSSTPPRSPAHSFYDYVQRAEAEDAYSVYSIYESGYDEKLIEKFKKEAGGEQSTTWKREYLCQFVVDETLAVVPEWRDEYVKTTERTDLYKFWQRYEAMDIGFRDRTVILFAHYDFERARLVIEDEWSCAGHGLNTERIVGAVREGEKRLGWVPEEVYRRVADNNNLILLSDMSSIHDIYFMATDKDTLDAMVNKVRIWVNAGRIQVDPKCKQLIGCLKYGIFKQNRKEFDRSSVYGHFDALAAMMYLVRNIDEWTNPIPTMHNMSHSTHFIAEQALNNIENYESIHTIAGISSVEDD